MELYVMEAFYRISVHENVVYMANHTAASAERYVDDNIDIDKRLRLEQQTTEQPS